jgi:hypothetical protein
MRRGIGCAVFLAMLSFGASTASAGTLCVPTTSIPGCPASAANEPTIGDAVTHGNNGDTILIGADSFNGGHPYNETVDDAGKSFHFVGAGVGKTIIQGQGSPAMTVSAGSSVADVTVSLHDEQGGTGLMLAGTATNVAVTGTGANNATNPIGVQLAGGTFSHGVVSLPVNGSDTNHYGGVIGPGTLSDSTVTAPVGIAEAMGFSPQMPVVHRVRIIANQGVLVGATQFAMDDSVIQTRSGAASELGIGLSQSDIFGSYALRHVDVIGSGAAGSVGIEAHAYGVTGVGHSTVVLDSSIIRGYATSISALADNTGIGPTSTTVTVKRSFYDTAHTSTQSLNGGTATITKDAASGNVDPLFVSTTDFHLRAGSPAIDAGNPTLATGESTTDLDGHPRAIAGKSGDAPIPDIGAYEFQPRSPTVKALASATRIMGFKKVRFTAAGLDASPGDALRFSWHFDDGATATGASVTHAFRAGRHTAIVTATDLDGFTATARVTITVLGPALSKLRLHSSRRAVTITYRDSEVATTTFKVFRVGSKRSLRTITNRDKPGKNRLRLGSLPAGRYRVVAVPRNQAGRGKAVTRRLRV